MPAAVQPRPRFDRVENALVTAAGYRHLAGLAGTPSAREHMLRQAVRWEARATRYEQELAFGAPGSAKLPEPNPCRKLYGPGPKGARCAGCALLHSYAPGNRTYHKCELRVFTRSQRSDHRMRWLACAKFEPRE